MSNIYRNMMKAAGTVSVLAACSLLSSCENRYNELPPKTDANIQYAIPYPATTFGALCAKDMGFPCTALTANTLRADGKMPRNVGCRWRGKPKAPKRLASLCRWIWKSPMIGQHWLQSPQNSVPQDQLLWVLMSNPTRKVKNL